MDSIFPAEEIPSHIVMAFRIIKTAQIENCSFKNDKNTKIFHLSNWNKDKILRTIPLTNITFENVTVVDCIGHHVKQGDRSLFSFYSRAKAIEILFDGSLFKNNKIGKFPKDFLRIKFYFR